MVEMLGDVGNCCNQRRALPAFLNLRPDNWHKDANRCCYGVHMYSGVSELDPSVSKSVPLSSGSRKTSP